MTDSIDNDWWRGAVLYQIYPRSYADANGDGMGDLRGIAAKLDHIASLGVDAIWISPFFKSPMKDFGYDVSDYCDVDPSFGNLHDFDALIVRAKELKLKVLIDLVLSHTSDQHPWFAESRKDKTNPKSDWYVWADAKPDGSPPNNWLSIFGGSAWAWDTRRCQYYLHNFLVEQPDLNFHNPAVRDALLAATKFWLDRGVDGFRLDTVNFYFHDRLLRDNPPAAIRDVPDIPASNPYSYQDHLYDKTQPENLGFLRDFRALLDQYPAITTVGEVGASLRGLEVMGEYTSGGDKLHMCYAFDLLGLKFGAQYVRARLEAYEHEVTEGWGCWAFSNHDVVRTVTRWGFADEREKAAPLLLALLVSLRGTACIYQGEELGLTEAQLAFEDLRDPYGIAFWPEMPSRDGCRTPMPWENSAGAGFSTAKPWLPIPDEHRALAVAVQEASETSVLHRAREILHWRKSVPALARGGIMFHDADEPVLSFSRSADGTTVLCVFNLSDTPQSFDASLLGTIAPLTGHGFASTLENETVHLPPFAAFYGLVI
ncbi:alpha-glucosidase family protein [Methylovirgula sp. 4M-Z18]|uniref:alpha-glucosidase family protein n=1 Tax=Methylovirgula sp. 4M-Z18 TaxID=2293567 RepID=UPI000E2FB46A|nr:alpha-glucosidase family protein [Methylovirgula sp. 4M-Z18]RFB78729.1 alpha-glucosidase [Methylovirgula sp. 4M-Z18]